MSTTKTSKPRPGTEPFNFRLTPAVRAELDRMAGERSTTASEAVRQLIAAWMKDPSIVEVGFPVRIGGQR